MWRPPISYSRAALLLPASRAAGSAVAGMTGQRSPPRTPLYPHSPLSTPTSRVIDECSWAVLKRLLRLNAFALLHARSLSQPIARLAAGLCLLSSLSSCAIWQRIVPQNVSAVCAESISQESCPAPQYVFDGQITADTAAAVAIAESKARDACAEQLEELQGCVRRHNEGKR